MALSGIAAAYAGNSHYRIEIWWTATQNVAGNYSTVTGDLWFWSDPAWDIYVNNRSGNITIDGTVYSFTTTLSSSGGKWVKLHSASKTVYHSSDGSKYVGVSGNFNFNISIGGALGSPTASGSWWLDTIPRASSVSSGISWTAGTQNLSISVSSASSGFTHVAYIYVQTPAGVWNYVAETGHFSTSTTKTFDSGDITRMYQAITQYENRPAKIVLYTYSGGTLIGTSEKVGTVYGVQIAKISFSNFNIGSNVSATVSPMYSGFTYSAKMVFGSFSKTWSIPTTSSSFTLDFTPGEVQSMFAQIPTANAGIGTVTVYSKYNGIDVNDGAPKPQYDPDFNFTASVVDSLPTFSGSGVTYSDINGTTSGITGANTPPYIIQNKSKLRVTIPAASRATAINGASMIRYEAVVAGKTETGTYSASATVTIDVNEINASTDAIMQLYAVDSRGNRTAVPITVKMLQYMDPVMITSVSRKNSFDTETTITLSGSVSPLTIVASNKNAILSAKYQYKPSGTPDTSYTAAKSMTVSGFPAYTTVAAKETLALDTAYDIKIIVTDRLGAVSVVKTVSTGVPLIFIDTVKKSVGVNKLPAGSESFEVAGTMEGERNTTLNKDLFYYPSIKARTTNGSPPAFGFHRDGYDGMALYYDGSDTYPLKSVDNTDKRRAFLNVNHDGSATDISWSDLNYLKTTGFYMGDRLANAPIVNQAGQWAFIEVIRHDDRFIMQRATDLFSNSVWFRRCHNSIWQPWVPVTHNLVKIWTGALFMGGSHTIYPDKKLSECPNGWLLEWSQYSGGATNSEFGVTFIPKTQGSYGGSGVHNIIGGLGWDMYSKYIYVWDDRMAGNASNESSPRSKSVLRSVYAW